MEQPGVRLVTFKVGPAAVLAVAQHLYCSYWLQLAHITLQEAAHFGRWQ
jgi:hypothetical protein